MLKNQRERIKKIKKYKKFVFPGVALIASLYGSLIFAVGAIVGYISTEIFCKKYLKTGKVKMLIFNSENWEVHLHHWLMGGAVILSAYFFGFIGSIPVIFLGVLGGLVFHDIYTDKKYGVLHENNKKWYHIVYRK